MEQKFATAFVGVNSLQVKRRPDDSWTQTPEQKREWNRRPPLREAEARLLRAGLAVPVRVSRVCSGSLTIGWNGRLARALLLELPRKQLPATVPAPSHLSQPKTRD